MEVAGMNVFVLCTGRSGSTTFAKACTHITNYTAAHESRPSNWKARLDYPDDHIEVDHRLSWFLGMLDERYPDACYVHLTRDPEKTAESWSIRKNKGGQMTTWADVVMYRPRNMPMIEGARLMVESVTANIRLFLKDKPHIVVPIEDPHDGFDTLWDRIDAEGDRAAAHAELDKRYNRRGRKKYRV